jgi:hypothetical protein
MYIICGVLWLIFGIAAGLFLLAFFAETAGFESDNALVLSFVQSISLETGVIRLVHLAGLFLITAFCFLVGVGLCSYGFAIRGEDPAKKDGRSPTS